MNGSFYNLEHYVERKIQFQFFWGLTYSQVIPAGKSTSRVMHEALHHRKGPSSGHRLAVAFSGGGVRAAFVTTGVLWRLAVAWFSDAGEQQSVLRDVFFWGCDVNECEYTRRHTSHSR